MKTAYRNQARAKRQYRGDPRAFYRVMSRSQKLSTEEFTKVVIPIRLSYEALRTGTASMADFNNLADCYNFVLLANDLELKDNQGVSKMCDDALAAMLAIQERYQRTQKWGLDFAAMRDLPPLIDFQEELMAEMTGGQLFGILREVSQRNGSSPMEGGV